MTPQQISKSDLRQALGCFVTGVTIATTVDGQGRPRGFTANSFSSVSLDPPLVSLCVGKYAASHDSFVASKAFSVNVLAEEQRETSRVFASKSADKFDRVSWRAGKTGSPLIDATLSWFDCETHSAVDAGDHSILIGRVVDFGWRPAHPLTYFQGGYLNLSLAEDVVAAAGHPLAIGAILEHDGSILFLRGNNGTLRLPEAPKLAPESDANSLHGSLRAKGIDATLNFIFAVFDTDYSRTSIYYRGLIRALRSDMDPSVVILSEADIPWQHLASDPIRMMLRRFLKERAEDMFGVYVGGAETGVVHPLANPLKAVESQA